MTEKPRLAAVQVLYESNATQVIEQLRNLLRSLESGEMTARGAIVVVISEKDDIDAWGLGKLNRLELAGLAALGLHKIQNTMEPDLIEDPPRAI